MIDKRITDLLTVLGNGLNEHLALLKEVNKKADMGTLDNFWDYQTVAESNEALIELERILNETKYNN